MHACRICIGYRVDDASDGLLAIHVAHSKCVAKIVERKAKCPLHLREDEFDVILSAKRIPLERLVDIAIPRMRDFRGLNPKSFDGRGNFSMGITEQIVFAEIDYDKIDKIRGLDICVTTTAQTNEAALELLKAFKFPFRT